VDSIISETHSEILFSSSQNIDEPDIKRLAPASTAIFAVSLEIPPSTPI
jgi:hypothetical protein